jgi:hypothetical protein
LYVKTRTRIRESIPPFPHALHIYLSLQDDEPSAEGKLLFYPVPYIRKSNVFKVPRLCPLALLIGVMKIIIEHWWKDTDRGKPNSEGQKTI